MSENTNDGGPAFPHPTECSDGRAIPHLGMTLRDWFAGQAMAALTVSEVLEAFRRNDYEGRQNHNTYAPAELNEVARLAYIQADAMIEERGTK